MRRLSPRVNVIPVIGKADSLTPSELKGFKKRVSYGQEVFSLIAKNSPQIMEDIEHYSIPVYNFPYDVEEDDEETIQDNSELRVREKLILHCNTKRHILGPNAFRYYWLGGRD